MVSGVPFSPLYPILDARHETRESLAAAVTQLADGGCRLVQLRAKELSTRDFLGWTESAVRAARRRDVCLVVNDRADVARLADADGVHVGQDDLSVSAARRLLGPSAVVGLSTHSLAQAMRADAMDVDYVAIGPIFATETKVGAEAPLGVDYVRQVRGVVTKPLVAIGGITLENAQAVLAAGADGVAVISALRRRSSAEETLEQLTTKWLTSLETREPNAHNRGSATKTESPEEEL